MSEGDRSKLDVNRALWDERVPVHVSSMFYDVDGFRAGRVTLQPFELAEVGGVAGKDLVHLQCHFGLDTLSWARLGASVTGLDFSEPAVIAARGLAAEVGLDAEFVAADVHDAVEALGGRDFDIVYTGLGALVWLPDLTRWARVVHALCRPGGFLYLSEFHPVHEVFGPETLTVMWPYFGRPEGVLEEATGTYTDFDAEFAANASWEWTHPVSEVLTALLGAGFVLETFAEHPYTLWERWPFLERRDDATYWFPDGMPELPLMYSLRARRPGTAG